MAEKSGSHCEMERGIIDRQIRYMIRLVDDLLDVARIARGKIQRNKKPVELSRVLSEAIDIASPMIEVRSQQLTVEVAKAGLTVLADEVRLAQVLANLLTNASKFTGTGGRIRVGAVVEGGEVLLSVADNGRGIPPDMLPRIFDIFVQGERSLEESRAGLGLGLSIAKNIAELHGGRLSVRSDGEGRGSEFEVVLPLLEASQPGYASGTATGALQPGLVEAVRQGS
jgi:signal transduction histidine kinase